CVGVLWGLAPAAARADRTVTGRVVYGTVLNDINELAPPTNLIQSSAPVKRVHVEFNDGDSLSVGQPWVTDDTGSFSITFSGTPTITIVTKAKNDYVAVKKHMGTGQNLETDHVLPPSRPPNLDYNNCLNGQTCPIGDVTVVSDANADDNFTTINGTYTNHISRAFYIAPAAYASGTHIESLYGPPLRGEKVTVRMGIDPNDNVGWYHQIPNTIYIPNNGAVTFWHEFGHYVQDRI